MPDFNTPQTERGPIRFRLRTLLLLVAIAAIGFAFLGSALRRAARHRRAAARLSEVKAEFQRLGGSISYTVSERPNRLQRLLGDPGVYEIQKVRLPGQTPVAGFRHLQSLEGMLRSWELDLNQSRISDSDLKHLRGWKGLRHLDLGRTYITDAGLVHLNGLTGLEVLRLDQTRVTAAGVRKLQESLRDTQITPTPRHWMAIAEIERLRGEVYLYPHPAVVVRFFHYSPRHRVTDAVLAHVMQLADLRTWVCLDLSETAVTDAGLKQLKDLSNLLELDLSETRITDAGLLHLKELPDLTRLSLRGTEVTDTGLEHLQALTPLGRRSTRGWPERGGLNLIDTQVTEDGVRNFRKALPDCNIER